MFVFAALGDAGNDTFPELDDEPVLLYMNCEGSLNVDKSGELPAELNVR